MGNPSLKECRQFGVKEAKEKFIAHPFCYLTGAALSLDRLDQLQFDHRKPVSKGGDNSLDNLGFAKKEANQAKGDLTVDEFVALCVKVAEHNGYTVKKSLSVEKS
jgi:5-methylcytosine-specific restriction endonuclease McrA